MFTKKKKITTIYLLVLIILCHIKIVILKRENSYFILPFYNTSLPLDTRVEDLVSRLTLDEMIDQMAHGGGESGPAPSIPRLGIEPFNFNTECLRGVVAPNKATSFPIAIAMGATFNIDLIFKMAEVIGTEARGIFHDSRETGDFGKQKGISCFSPVINILRHPLWGRAQEVYGEDPFLISKMTTSYISGLQGNNSRYIRAAGGCKHFLAYSGPEDFPSSRFSFDAKVSEQDLNLSYLPQWKSCVEAGTLSVMCSYNKINGIPSCGNKNTLKRLLREEIGFDGFVVSDDDAIRLIYTQHNYTSSLLKAVALAASAGVDLELPTKFPAYKLLKKAVKKRLVSYSRIKESNKRLFKARMKLGLLDRPINKLTNQLSYHGVLKFESSKKLSLNLSAIPFNPYSSITSSILQTTGHRTLALRSALESFVLLKNKDDFLPFKSNQFQKITMIGPMADNLEQLFGLYSPAIDERFSRTPYQSLKEVLGKRMNLVQGCNSNKCDYYKKMEVIEASIKSDLIIVTIGTGQEVEGEGMDRRDLFLPGFQPQLISDIIQYSSCPIIVVVFSAGPVDIGVPFFSPKVSSILQCFLPGQSAGEAFRKIIFLNQTIYENNLKSDDGLYVPSGRLPYTWPKSLDQVPPMTDYSMEGRTYRYWNSYDPLFSFGFGLSYSKFYYQNLIVEPKKLLSNKSIEIEVKVEVINMGPYTADEVTQVYIRWRDAPFVMPQIQLVAFNKNKIFYNHSSNSSNDNDNKNDINYKYNNNKLIILTFKSDQLKVWDKESNFYLKKGIIDIFVGGQQPGQKIRSQSNVLFETIQIV